MNEIERKAVELLREEFAKVGISEVSLNLPVDAACVRAISRVLAALVAEVRSQQDAWQPIETCPSEDRVVLFCDERGNRWTDVACNKSADCTGFPPKYWRELPAPPTLNN